MKFAKTLTRDEMKNVKAGEDAWLNCVTPNGSESWYRTDIEGTDPEEECEEIYPGYDASEVDGSYGSEPVVCC